MLEVDVRMVQDEEFPPGTMKEILVQANIGHKGVRIITPALGGDLRCIHPKAISLITEQPLNDLENKPMTEKQWNKNKNRNRFVTYMAYNASHDTIILPKNKLVGQCQLILQPNEKAYQQELSAMWQERLAENQKENNRPETDQLSRDWVLDNFCLRDNPIIKANPEVGEELIRVLQQKGRVFKGGALRDQVRGKGVAGRTD